MKKKKKDPVPEPFYRKKESRIRPATLRQWRCRCGKCPAPECCQRGVCTSCARDTITKIQKRRRPCPKGT
jgi:hypothetical protein